MKTNRKCLIPGAIDVKVISKLQLPLMLIVICQLLFYQLVLLTKYVLLQDVLTIQLQYLNYTIKIHIHHCIFTSYCKMWSF